MGYLNNSSVTVDAILTKKGRELLAMGRDEFKITQFALADDEIDYDLWNPAHPLGSNYYGIIIESMPLVEPLPDETQTMKYKLVTLPKKTTRIPVVKVPQTSITLESQQTTTIQPQTVNYEQGNKSLGYTAILSNSDVAELRVAPGGAVTAGASPTIPRFIGDQDSPQSVAVVGHSFEIVAKANPTTNKTADIVIIGNETGGRTNITLTVKKMQVFTSPNIPLDTVNIRTRRTF